MQPFEQKMHSAQHQVEILLFTKYRMCEYTCFFRDLGRITQGTLSESEREKKGFWNIGSESWTLLSIWTRQVGAQGMLHKTSEDVVPLLSPFWLVINLAWGQLLSFHREPENLGSIWILERFTHSCCSTWAESRPLSCSLWKLFQSSDCRKLFELNTYQHKPARRNPKNPFTE